MSELGNKEIMAKNIKHYMDVNGKSRNDICEALGFSYSTFTDWINANSYPRIDKIEMMANYFNIKKSCLVENKGEEQEQHYYLNEETRQIAQEIFENENMRLLFDTVRDISPGRLKAYVDFMQALKDKEDGNY